MKKLLFLGFALAVSVSFLGCTSEAAAVDEAYKPNESVDDYIQALQGLNLSGTEIGKRWIDWADPSTQIPMLSLTPFTEIYAFDAAVPEAAYYLFEGIRGQSLTVRLEPEAKNSMAYFADVFALPDDYDPRKPAPEAQVSLNPTASAYFAESDPQVRSGSSRIVFEPRNTRFFLLRLIPRLLEGGRITVRVENEPIAQVWPVDGTGSAQIWSFFGDSRDGGGRVHHGVDIFAPKGTPIRAPTAGRITRVSERKLGGLSISLSDDERRLSWYFAHMDSYGDVKVGQVVEAGHVLGTVGNTGNAVTTPPHLHLGIYDRGWGGPVDPWYFLVPLSQDRRVSPETILANFKPASKELDLGANYYGSDFKSTALSFYRQLAGRNPTLVSAARRDREGTLLHQSELPILRTELAEPLLAKELIPNKNTLGPDGQKVPGLRLVALRNGAAGFRFPDGQIRWLLTSAGV